jgi:hypothetical protein
VNPLIGATDPDEENVRLVRTSLISIFDAEMAAGKTVPEAVTTLVDHLDLLLMAGNLKARYADALTPNPRSIIIDAVSSMSVVNTDARVQEALYLVVSSPEYIHQK